MTSSLKLCSNFTWSLLKLGGGGWGRKVAKMVAVRWPRWPPCPYMVKTFPNLLQNRIRLWAESLHKPFGTRGLLKLLKWLSYIDVCLFYSEVKFASLSICMGPIHLYGKMLRITNSFSSEAAGPIWLKFYVEPPWAGERKTAKMVAVY